ncbi:MAG: serine hydrolase domain-containing protein [Anaerovoracaceae bacterium]
MKCNDIIGHVLNEYLKECLYLYDLPGLCISARIGKYSYKNAMGYQNFIDKTALLEKHIFHMASVSKLFVSTAIMQLIQGEATYTNSRGENETLSLNSKLVEILHWLKADESAYSNSNCAPTLDEISIKDAITHTAGLTDVIDYAWDKPEFDDGALKRYLQSDEVTKSKLLWPVSENKFCYSNIGFEILGAVIAKVSGISFEEYVEENILLPLNMDNSKFRTFLWGQNDLREDKIRENPLNSLNLKTLQSAGLALPHTKDDDKHIVLEKQYPYNRAHGPSSTLTTNSYDIEKFAEAHLKKTFFKKDLYDTIWSEYTTVPNNGEGMGLGWFMREQNGYKLMGHEGNDDGFRASFWICPELDAYVAIMANISKAPVKKINRGVFDILCERKKYAI